MAAPPEVSVHNLSGKWELNSTLSEDILPILELQEVAFLVRILVSKAQVSLSLKQTEEDSVSRIDSTQTSLGHTLEETWLLNWEPRDSIHTVFGKMTVRARLVSPTTVQETVLQGHSERYKADWEGDVIELNVENEGWTSTQVWGFTTVDDSRRYVRRSVVRKGDISKVVQVVYDWVGPNDV